MKEAQERLYKAYKAYMNAEDPEFKKFWLELMKHFSREFN